MCLLIVDFFVVDIHDMMVLLYLFWHILAALNLSRKVECMKKWHSTGLDGVKERFKWKKIYIVAYLFNEKLGFIQRVTKSFEFNGIYLFTSFMPHFVTNAEAKWFMTFFFKIWMLLIFNKEEFLKGGKVKKQQRKERKNQL